MHKLFMFGLIAMIALLGVQRGISPALAAEDDGSKITITAPKDGDAVGDTFELMNELVKGSKAANAHVYFDGKYLKGFDGRYGEGPKGKQGNMATRDARKHAGVAETPTSSSI